MDQGRLPSGYARVEHDGLDKGNGNDFSRSGSLTLRGEERDQLGETACLYANVSLPKNHPAC